MNYANNINKISFSAVPGEYSPLPASACTCPYGITMSAIIVEELSVGIRPPLVRCRRVFTSFNIQQSRRVVDCVFGM